MTPSATRRTVRPLIDFVIAAQRMDFFARVVGLGRIRDFIRIDVLLVSLSIVMASEQMAYPGEPNSCNHL
jgi:hypothetical protein